MAAALSSIYCSSHSVIYNYNTRDTIILYNPRDLTANVASCRQISTFLITMLIKART